MSPVILTQLSISSTIASGTSVNGKGLSLAFATTMFFGKCHAVLVRFLTNNQNGWLDLTSSTPFATRSPARGSSVGSITTRRDVSVVTAILAWEYPGITVRLHSLIRLRRRSAFMSFLSFFVSSPSQSRNFRVALSVQLAAAYGESSLTFHPSNCLTMGTYP